MAILVVKAFPMRSKRKAQLATTLYDKDKSVFDTQYNTIYEYLLYNLVYNVDFFFFLLKFVFSCLY